MYTLAKSALRYISRRLATRQADLASGAARSTVRIGAGGSCPAAGPAGIRVATALRVVAPTPAAATAAQLTSIALLAQVIIAVRPQP